MLNLPNVKRAQWVKASYSDILSNRIYKTNMSGQGAPYRTPCHNGQSHNMDGNADNIPTIVEANSLHQVNMSQVTWANRNTRNNTITINSDSQEDSGHGTKNQSLPPHPDGTVSGVTNLKHKMEEIDPQRIQYQTEQTKLADTVVTILRSLTQLSKYNDQYAHIHDPTKHGISGRSHGLQADPPCAEKDKDSITKEKEGRMDLIQGGIVFGRGNHVQCGKWKRCGRQRKRKGKIQQEQELQLLGQHVRYGHGIMHHHG
jgi:hypothetical protein